MELKEIITVGDLKDFLQDIEDDVLIYSQVVGEDHSAWSVNCTIYKAFSFINLQMSHPQLKSLNPLNIE